MEKKLEVKNLRISFKTVSGKLQAVRDISFDLNKGETLAIVGESGSGKSVTSKAILGILAGNSIVEGGEIIYDGRDLLKIPEEEFYKLRGDKISMIFQDPLSSLNPIMRIGKQLTEAMLLKGKARQKASRETFNNLLSLLRENMILVYGKENEALINEKCKFFDTFEFKHIELEKAYNEAHDSATETLSDVENAIFLIEKSAFYKEQRATILDIIEGVKDAKNEYVLFADATRADEICTELKKIMGGEIKKKDYAGTYQLLLELKEILARAIEGTMPNFFAMGFYLVHSKNAELPKMGVEELNKFLRQYLDDNFMLDFIDDVEKALQYSANASYEKKKLAVADLKKAMAFYSDKTLDKKEAYALADKLSKVVKESIDNLEITKDSFAYTFETGIKSTLDTYFAGIKKNVVENRKHDKQQKKYDALIAKGKAPDWKVVPAATVDLELTKDNIVAIVKRLHDHYSEKLEKKGERDYAAEAIAVIDYLKLNASGVVLKITKKMARHRALKIMEEVGISDARKRYKQYPFEFSGGMRQRIVIAIALAANPDILICDEPTTALDVTIQAQILELINKLKAERNLSIIFITHDLGVVANMADRIAVMYAGKIVEYGTAEDIFYRPAHPYTWALLSSMPDLDTKEKLEAIPGTPPNMIYPPVGDAFAARNKYAMNIDFERQPPMFRISDTHSAATWLLHKDAPKIEIPKTVSDRIARMEARNREGGAANE